MNTKVEKKEDLANWFQEVISNVNHPSRKDLVKINGELVYIDDIDMHVEDGPHDFVGSFAERAWGIFSDGTARELNSEETEALNEQNDEYIYTKASEWYI